MALIHHDVTTYVTFLLQLEHFEHISQVVVESMCLNFIEQQLLLTYQGLMSNCCGRNMVQIYIRDLHWRNIFTWYNPYAWHVLDFSFVYAKLVQILFHYAFLFPRKTSSSTLNKVECWTIKAQPGSTRNNLDIKN